MRAACLGVAALLAVAWGLGEAVGALIGPRRAARTAERGEVKPVAATSLDPNA